MEKEQHPKTSKLAIMVFIITILNIIGIVIGGFVFGSLIEFVLGIILSVIMLTLFFLLIGWIKKRNLGGIKLAKFSFYTLLILTIIDIIGSIILMNYAKNLNDFSTTTTSKFFDNNLAVLKENSTNDFKRLISYENETADLKTELEKVGAIKECVQEKYDYSLVSFGPDIKFDRLSFDMRGEYSIRCYGENKSFDLKVLTEYQKGKWLVDSYEINPNLGADLIKSENKNKE